MEFSPGDVQQRSRRSASTNTHSPFEASAIPRISVGFLRKVLDSNHCVSVEKEGHVRAHRVYTGQQHLGHVGVDFLQGQFLAEEEVSEQPSSHSLSSFHLAPYVPQLVVNMNLACLKTVFLLEEVWLRITSSSDTNELIYKTDSGNLQWGRATRARWEARIVRELGMDMYTVLYLTWTTNRDFLYSTWNAAQCHAAAWKGAGFGQNGFMLCVWLSAFAAHLNLTQCC